MALTVFELPLEHEQIGTLDTYQDDATTQLVAPLEETLRREGPGHWLWCLDCHRFFQARHVRIDYLGNRQGCAFCAAAGFNLALFSWDVWRNAEEPWPASASELRHGMRLKTWTFCRHISLTDDSTTCLVYIDPEDCWVYELTFSSNGGREIDEGDGQPWGTRKRPIVVPLTHLEQRAARRGRWQTVEQKGRQLARNPLRLRRCWRATD